jgi:hypothetical protein
MGKRGHIFFIELGARIGAKSIARRPRSAGVTSKYPIYWTREPETLQRAHGPE